MSGKCWIENAEPRSSTIHIIIPLSTQARKATMPAEKSASIKQQKNLKILLVEDNQASQTVIVKMLENLGHHASTATNGLEAVDAVTNNHYDLILMDINLPIMDGIEATQTIRKFTDPDKARIPILGITASSEFNSKYWLQAGINGYILKPVSLSTLNNTINSLFASSITEN